MVPARRVPTLLFLPLFLPTKTTPFFPYALEKRRSGDRDRLPAKLSLLTSLGVNPPPKGDGLVLDGALLRRWSRCARRFFGGRSLKLWSEPAFRLAFSIRTFHGVSFELLRTLFLEKGETPVFTPPAEEGWPAPVDILFPRFLQFLFSDSRFD